MKLFFTCRLLGSIMIVAVASSRIVACRAFITSHLFVFPTAMSSPVCSGFDTSSPTARFSSTVSEDTTSTTATNTSSSTSTPSPAAVLNKVFQTDTRPIILFDGICNLCNNAVNLAIDWDPHANLRFAALQSDVGKSLLQYFGRDANDISSIVLVTKDGAFVKSDAILGIAESLMPLPLPPLSTNNKITIRPLAKLASAIVPKYLRDLIYDGVADNRYSVMGKRMECRYDADGEFEDRFVNDDILLEIVDDDE